MRFNVYTDDQLNEMQTFKLLEPGDYDFQVLEAKEQISKKGSEMISLKLKVWDMEGKEHIIFDYLLEALAYKIKHFCQATGLEYKWESGTLTADDCVGKCGTVDIFIQKSKDPQYSDKNSVKDYIHDVKSERVQQPAVKKDEFSDDTIPF